jgi:hypothetical protein
VSAASDTSVSPLSEPAVTLEILVRPADSDAIISVDGVRIDGHPPRVTLDKSARPVPIQVTADGFESAEIQAVPNRNHVIVVPLRPNRPPPGPASAQPVPSASALPALPAKRPSPAPPHRRAVKNRKPSDPLVTDYPF